MDPFRFMIAEQADSPDKVSAVNRSPTILISTIGLVTANDIKKLFHPNR